MASASVSAGRAGHRLVGRPGMFDQEGTVLTSDVAGPKRHRSSARICASRSRAIRCVAPRELQFLARYWRNTSGALRPMAPTTWPWPRPRRANSGSQMSACAIPPGKLPCVKHPTQRLPAPG